MSLLGVDIGTSGCKAAAFSLGGQCLAAAYREYPTLHPQPNYAELDSRDVFNKVKSAIGEVAAHTARDPVTAMAISTMGEAMTPVSADRRILGDSILGIDLRGTEYVKRLQTDIGQEAFYAINPNILAPNYSLPKLLWLKEHEPELFGAAWKFLLWGDLVAFLFGCEPLTNFSLANRTLLFDIRKEDWSDILLDWAGVPREKLPKCVATGTISGTISNESAAELGLPRDVTLVVGAHDQCCNSLGAGIHQAGKAVCGIGTIECIAPVYDHIPSASAILPTRLNVEHHALPGLYLSFLYNQSGVLVKWFRNTFAHADQQLINPGEDIYEVLIRELPKEPTPLLVLPHFEITGSPDFISDSAGVIAGLRTTTSRGDILKAIIEGSTFYFLDSLNALKTLGIDTSEFIATGGGAKSDAWLQIKADIFGVPLVRPRITECGVLGASIVAGMATGVFSSPAEAVRQFVKRDRVFEPNTARHAVYREQYEKYRRLYPAMKGLLADL